VRSGKQQQDELMTRLSLLANPMSGSGNAFDVAEALRASGAVVIAFELDRIDDALAARPERLVVAGRDGSLGRVAAASARASIPLGIVPTGTANDLAHLLDLPTDPAEAARVAAVGSLTRRLDLGWMADRPFLNVASIGLPPAAARKAGGLKRLLGPVAYAVGGVQAGLFTRPVGCLIRCDGDQLFAGEAWQITIASSGAFGAGARIDADPADGLLDALVLEAGSRAALAWRAHGLRRGSIGSQPGVLRRRARVVELEVSEATPFNVDGEVVESRSVRFETSQRAVEVVVG
jgi:diacylglycerol kinase (ATP)